MVEMSCSIKNSEGMKRNGLCRLKENMSRPGRALVKPVCVVEKG